MNERQPLRQAVPRAPYFCVSGLLIVCTAGESFEKSPPATLLLPITCAARADTRCTLESNSSRASSIL